MTGFVLCGLALPAFAGNSQRITIELPLPAAALEQQQNRELPDEHTLAHLAPAALTQATATKQPVPAIARSRVEQHLPGELKQLNLKLIDGQSLYLLFRDHQLSQADLATMLSSSRQTKRLLSRLHPGQKITLWITPQQRVEKMLLQTRGPTDALLERTPSGYRLSKRLDRSPEQPTAQRVSVKEIPDVPRQTITDKPDTPARELRAAVKSGDSMYLIFKRNKIPGGDLVQLMNAKGARILKRLQPGQQLDLALGPDNHLQSLKVALDETRTLYAQRNARGFSLVTKTLPLDRHVSTASATIENSLFIAGQRAGLSDPIIMRLVEIFGWDVDFALDIRAGDRFTLIYEELFRDGKKIRDGQILAADFFNRGRSLRALRYQDSSGRVAYFTPKGLSMRKAFLRTPVNYLRISSRFNPRRKHPVLNRIRAHKGVDYSAPRGTPIKAAGDGRVSYAGRKGGYGKTVILQHGGKYSTLYGHMSRLHKRARKGKRVYQGQTIGYIGSTGLATGPHLHYEFRVRGIHKDPLRVKLPKALPIDRQYKADFFNRSRGLIADLDRLATTSLAANP